MADIFRLLRYALFPILRYQQFEDVIHNEVDDPIGGVLQAVAPDTSNMQAMIELIVFPANGRRIRYSQTSVEQLARPFSQFFASKRKERFVSDEELNKTSSRMHDNEKDLQAASVKLGNICLKYNCD